MHLIRLTLISGFVLFVILPGISSSQSLQLADSLRTRGENFKNKGNFRQAEFYLREAVRIYEQQQDTAGWMETARPFASTLVQRTKYEEAFSYYDKLLDWSKAKGKDSLYADILNSKGWAFNKMGQPERALTFFEQALPLSQKVEYTLLTAVIYDNIGLSYFDLGDYGKSLELRKKALNYFEELDRKSSMAIVLNNIGRLYQRLLLYDKALDHFSRSLAMRHELGNVNMLAIIYDNMGGLQKTMGNYDQALISYQKSLEYRRKAGNPLRTARTLNNIGTLYNELGDPTKALDYYRESLAIKEKSSNPAGLATAYKNIANRLWDLDQREEALGYYNKALELRRKAGNPQDLATSLLDLSRVELDRGNYSKALQYAKQGRAIADSLNDYELLASSSSRLGEVHQKLGKPSEAINYYKQSLAYAGYQSRSSQLGPLLSLARTFHTLGSDSTLDYARRAIKIIEEERSNTGADSDIKSSYFRQYTDFYINQASWIIEYEQNSAEAYHYAELAKARSLADELIQASERIDEQLPEEVRIERNKMLNEIDRLYSKLREAGKAQNEDIKKKIRAAELEYSAYQNELHEKYPEYKKLEMQEPITLQQAQASCEDGTAILEYAINDDRMIAFLITQDEVAVEVYSFSDQQNGSGESLEITRMVQKFRDAILAHAGRAELDLYSSPLYNLLLKPFEEKLSTYENLIIVPDGALAYLPFEAIRYNNRYLIEDFYIKYLPSITSLTLLQESDKDYEKELLAVAGSKVQGLASAGSRTNALSALPSTLIEVDSIASHFQNAVTLKEEQVTEQALKQVLNQNYRFIHLATHGVIDEDYPAQSGLALSGAQNLDASASDDGLLKSSEIYRLNLNSDMVVLSACNTGLGKVVKGEGMLGLQRSFFYAGTSSVVVSLWNVYDRSTAHLMNEFYKSILSGDHAYHPSWIDQFARWTGWDKSIPFGEKAAAMKTAKLRLINHPIFSHPVYWAPFIVVGR